MQILEQILQAIDEEIEKQKETGSSLVDTPGWRLYVKTMERAKDIIRNHMNDGWIPVEEALPEEDGIYIIDDRTFNSSWIHTAGFKVSSKAWCENHGVYYDDKYGRYEDGRVIAWQSLPEPYKAERSDSHDGA